MQGCLCYFPQAGMLVLLSTSRGACVTFHKPGCLCCFPQAGMLVLLSTSRDACVTFHEPGFLGYFVVHKQGCLCYSVCCVRDAEGGETTPSFGHPSNVRWGKGSAQQPPYIPPIRREGRLYPS